VQVSTKSPSSDKGHIFFNMDVGMTDILCPSLYVAIHPITILLASDKSSNTGTSTETWRASWLLGTTASLGIKPGQSESLEEHTLCTAKIGDIAAWTGAARTARGC
jgi:hypothetical protein